MLVNSRYFSSDESNKHSFKDESITDEEIIINEQIDPIVTEEALIDASSTIDKQTDEISDNVEETVENKEPEESTEEPPATVSVIPGVGMMQDPTAVNIQPDVDTSETIETEKIEPETIEPENDTLTEEELISKHELDFVTEHPSEPVIENKTLEIEEPSHEKEEIIETMQHHIEESAMEIQSIDEKPIEIQDDAGKLMIEKELKSESESRESTEDTSYQIEETFWHKWIRFLKAITTPSTSWWLHFGNGLAICSMVMQEMLPLRCFLVGANACALVFYQLQKPPLTVPSYWSLIFLTGHSIMIIRLLLENRSVNMSDIEHIVYCNAFREYGFTPFQFKRVMKLAKYLHINKGDIICNQGAPKKKTMYVLGAMELQQNGRSVGGLINGFVGDIMTSNVWNDNNKKDEEKKIEKQNNINDVKPVEASISESKLDEKSDEKSIVNVIEKQNNESIENVINFVTDEQPIDVTKIESEMENKAKSETKLELQPETELEPALEIVSDSVNLSDVAEQTEPDVDISITIKPDSAVIETDEKKVMIESDENKVEQIEMKTGFNIANAIESIHGKDNNMKNDRWDHTAVALEKCTIFVWDRKELNKLLSSDPRLKAAAMQAMGGDLRSKLKTDKKFNSIKTYREMLEIVMYNNSIVGEEKLMLKKFRDENGITQTEHEKVVKGLGWTLEEYDRGLKTAEKLVEQMRHWYLLNLTKKYSTD